MAATACRIVPPFLLERLARSSDYELGAYARTILELDAVHRAGRAAGRMVSTTT